MKLLVVVLCWIGASPLFSAHHDDIPLVPINESASEPEMNLSGPYILKLFSPRPSESLRTYLEAERTKEELEDVITVGHYFSIHLRKDTGEAALYTLLQLLFDGGIIRAAEGKPDTSAIICLSIAAGLTLAITGYKWIKAYQHRESKKDLATHVEAIRTEKPALYALLEAAFTENPKLRLILPPTSKERRMELRVVVAE